MRRAEADEGEGDGSMKKWLKIHIASWLCLAAIVPAVIIGIIVDMDGETAGTMLGLLFLSWFILLIVSFIVRHNDADVKAKRELKAQKQQEKFQKRQEELAVARQKAWERRHIEEKERQQKIRDNWPVSAVIVTTQDKTKNKSGLGSAVVGGMIAGPIGAVVGASVGKKTVVTGQMVTFSVKYQSGRTGIETVEVGSERFNFLSSLLLK